MGNILVHVTEQSDQGARLHLESLSSAEKICRIAVRTSGERTILCVRTSLLWPFRERKDVWLPGGIPDLLYVAENSGKPYRVKVLRWQGAEVPASEDRGALGQP